MIIAIANFQGIHPNAGGIENISWNLAKEFTRNGHKVYFISYIPPYNEDKLCLPDEKFKTFYLPNRNKLETQENLDFLSYLYRDLNIEVLLNQSANIISFSRLLIEAKELGKTQTIIVSSLHFNPQYFYYDLKESFFDKSRLGKSPYKWTKELIRFLFYKAYYKKKVLIIEGQKYNYIYSKSNAFVLLSDHFKESFKEMSNITNDSKLYSITNSVSKPSSCDIVLRPKQKTILFVGRLVRSLKRPDRLIEIWKDLHYNNPDWKLIIIGDGHYKWYLQKLIIKYKIRNIVFAGKTSPLDYYREASMLCMTSTIEGFGLVLAEAQQMGCIPFAFDSFDSVKEIITDKETGFLITPFDKKEYIDKIQMLISDSTLRNEISSNCINKDYTRYDIRNIANEWLELFTKLQL